MKTALALLLVAGCSVLRPVDKCYDLVGINPASRVAIIFDSCQGYVEYQNLPASPIERAIPES